MMKRMCHAKTNGGFTLIESILSILVVGVMFVAALSVTANSQVNQKLTADHSQGVLLADMLMTEILEQSYEDPLGSTSLGRETPELSGTRATWDDVDDYDGWTSSPPEDKIGLDLAGLGSGWERSVVVHYVSPGNLALKVTGTNTGVKRIVVTVKRDGRIMATLYGLRTGARETVAEPIDPRSDKTISIMEIPLVTE